MVFCRFSIARIKGGQTNLTVNQINMAKAIAWEKSVKLIFMAASDYDPVTGIAT
jgi:hypothetical protein